MTTPSQQPTPETDSNLETFTKVEHGIRTTADYVHHSVARRLERERDEARQKCKEWALGVEQSNTDIVDMLRDEFQRIKALSGNTGVRKDEITGICTRAIATIEQTFPVIVQRDNLEQERDQLRKVCDELAETSQQVVEYIQTTTSYSDVNVPDEIYLPYKRASGSHAQLPHVLERNKVKK